MCVATAVSDPAGDGSARTDYHWRTAADSVGSYPFPRSCSQITAPTIIGALPPIAREYRSEEKQGERRGREDWMGK